MKNFNKLIQYLIIIVLLLNNNYNDKISVFVYAQVCVYLTIFLFFF